MTDLPDQRLQPGAYLKYPPNLYEVIDYDERRHVVELRNCRTEQTQTHSPEFVVCWFKLVKAAPVVPDFLPDEPQPHKEVAA